MNNTINVKVRNKIATAPLDVTYICGNSDFIVAFDFDEEWEAYDVKTARFVYNGTYQDVIFIGNQCAVPIITDTYNIQLGIFANNLSTTTAAWIPAKKSVLCSTGGIPVNPAGDIYAQIMELLQDIEIIDRETIAEAVTEAVAAAETAKEQAEKVDTALGDSSWIGFELDDNGEMYAVLSPGSEASFYLDENGYLGVQMNV